MSAWADNAAAFMHLAITERRLAHRYQRLANEAADQGDGYQYRQNAAEAKRLWNAAKWHLSAARDHHTLATRKH